MIASIARKGIKAILIMAVVSGCILILPLAAQESQSPQTPKQPLTPNTIAGEVPPAAGDLPTGMAPPVQLTDEQLIQEARMTSQMNKPQPAVVAMPPDFKVKDYPNDSGSSFVIEWPFTQLEESTTDPTKLNYKYRIYHAAGLYSIQLVVTSNPELNKKNLIAMINRINGQVKPYEIIKKYDIFLTILKNDTPDDKKINTENLKKLVETINSIVGSDHRILNSREKMYLRQAKAYDAGQKILVYSSENDALVDSIKSIPNVVIEDSAVIANISALKMGTTYLVFSTDDENIAKSVSGPEFQFVIVDKEIPRIDAADGIDATYVDLNPTENTLSNLKTSFWSKKKNDKIQAYQWTVPDLPVLDKNGQPRFNPATNEPITKPDIFTRHYFQLAVVQIDPQGKEIGETRVGPSQGLIATSNFFNYLRTNNILGSILYCIIVLWFISHAKKGKELFIRKIAGLDAVDEAVGRATEMGRPILYLTGLDSLSTIATIAAVNILGQVAKKVAHYESQILNPHRDPVVMSVCQEVVKSAYTEAGRPDAYNPDNIFYITDDQFSYVAAIDGIMVRERPATNIFMGYYYAESLILAETGASTGAIQIAGTDSLAQLPFFITTCDYTLIGEELYAASAYLAREPKLLGSLKGQDAGKLFMMIMLVIGVILMTISTKMDIINQIFQAQ